MQGHRFLTSLLLLSIVVVCVPAQEVTLTTEDMVTEIQLPPKPKLPPLPPYKPFHPIFSVTSKWMYIRRVAFDVRKYVSVTVLPLSMLFNGFSILIFMQPRRRRQSASFLMTGIAVADILALAQDWNLMIFDFTDFSIDSYGQFCEFIMYITYVCRSLSSWYILLFTVERFISVKFPLKKSAIVTRKRVLLALAITTVLVSVAESYYLVFFKYHGIGCGVSKKYTGIFKKIKFVFREILGFIVPSLLTAALNGIIINTLRTWAKQQSSLKGPESKGKEKDNSALTFMLIAVSTFSIVVYCPRSISQMYFDAHGSLTYKENIVDKFLECFAILNHSCNFFLYCLSGKTFREDFLWIISCRRCEFLLKLMLLTSTCGTPGHLFIDVVFHFQMSPPHTSARLGQCRIHKAPMYMQ